MIGTKLGAFEIVGLLGEGGMGQVFRARDSRLQRDVALKLLPSAFASDTDRLARFQREAQLVAQLNHPNIAAIYGLEESKPKALVLELVEGPTLAERIAQGPIPVDEVLPIAKQIADALEYAHEHGVMHRDLKPANIKLKPDGTVKVLDFGLAKALNEDARSPVTSNSPTLSLAATQAGVILGTAAYMSPEQAKGKGVDRRADIWAFGVVVYEMLTGERMFEGETISDTLAQVLTKEPDLSRVPAKARKLLARCLQKDPKQRLRDIGEARFLLDETAAEMAPPVRVGAVKAAWIAAAVATLAAMALGIIAYRHYSEDMRIVKLFLLPPVKGTFVQLNSIAAVSPDGRRIAFLASVDGKVSLWVRELDALAARPLPGTDDARFPFWSPDSRTVAFFGTGKLKKISVAGGAAVTLCDAAQGFGGSWSTNNIIVFSPGSASGLLRVPAEGGMANAVTELDQSQSEISHRYPWFLPDGKHFLYTARNSAAEKTTIYVGDLDSKARRRVRTAASNAAFSPPAYLLFVSDRTLFAQPFDAGTGKTTGEPVPIGEDVDVPYGNFAETHFSVSQNGLLAYSSGGAGGNLQLTWFDQTGKPVGTVGSPGQIFSWPAISPDGKTVAVDRLDPQTGSGDVWLHDLTHNTNSRFTLGPKSNVFPVWSPDGSHIAFSTDRDGELHLYQRATSATGEEALDSKPGGIRRATDWSRDGRYIFEERRENSKPWDIWVLPLFGDKKPFPYLNGEFDQLFAKLSPDSRWLAYQSDRTKRPEIYVETFPMRGGTWQISTNGGSRPVWSRDGKELYFISLDQKMMAVEIRGGPKFEWGTPKPLFDVRMENAASASFDVSKDGRFLIPTRIENVASVPITVVVNWTAMLKK